MSVVDSVPSSSEDRYLAGLLAFEHEEYEQAIDAFLVCLGANDDPRVQRLAKNYLGECYARLGARALREDRFADALNDYSRAISQASSYPDFHLGRARALLGLGNAVEHERALQRALELHPRYVDALLALAAFQYDTDPERGIGTFEHACEGSQDLFGEPYHQVLAAHRAGDSALVRQTLLSLRSPGAIEANSLAATAAMHVRADDVEAAEAAYRRALDLAPRYADIHCKYGQLLLTMDRPSEAVAELRIAVEINPRYIEALTYLGFGLIREGRPSEGTDFILRALEIDPLYPPARTEAARLNLGRSAK